MLHLLMRCRPCKYDDAASAEPSIATADSMCTYGRVAKTQCLRRSSCDDDTSFSCCAGSLSLEQAAAFRRHRHLQHHQHPAHQQHQQLRQTARLVARRRARRAARPQQQLQLLQQPHSSNSSLTMQQQAWAQGCLSLPGCCPLHQRSRHPQMSSSGSKRGTSSSWCGTARWGRTKARSQLSRISSRRP